MLGQLVSKLSPQRAGKIDQASQVELTAMGRGLCSIPDMPVKSSQHLGMWLSGGSTGLACLRHWV